MPAVTSQETVLRVAAADADPLTLRLEASRPAAVRIEVQGTCACAGGGTLRPGSYTDTDFGTR
ncbi:hypothetical protein ACTAQI_21595 [Pseudarthrobacter sp. alpha12b]